MSNFDFLDELLDAKAEAKEDRNEFDLEDKVLAPLLTEINLINDQAVRFFVRSVLVKAPLFWSIPSSFSGKYHPPDEHYSSGNVLHTQRVVRTVQIITEAQERNEYEIDLLIAAALLHDVTKGVENAYGEPVYDPMHPYTVDRLVKMAMRADEKLNHVTNRSTTLYLEDEAMNHILRLIRCSHGRWSPIPETFPISSLDWTIHLADNIASKLHIITDGPDFDKGRWTPRAIQESKIPEASVPDGEPSPLAKRS